MELEYIQQLRESIRIFEREIFVQNNASCCNGISLAQCHCLLEIEKNSEISISELAGQLSLNKSTISRTVEGLVNIGLVDRIIPKENRRKTVLTLTNNGMQVCATINSTHNHYIKNVIQNFSGKEQTELLNLFEKLSSSMANMRPDKCCE